MEDIVVLIVGAEVEQNGEKLRLRCHKFSGIENILFQNKRNDLNYFHSAKSKGGSLLPFDLDLLKCFFDEGLQKRF